MAQASRDHLTGHQKNEEQVDQTPEIMKMQERAFKVNTKAFVNVSKPTISSLQIQIPPDNEDQHIDAGLEESHNFQNGEENLHESSEKKRVKADTVPKTGAIKTGTNLGHSSS